MAIQAESVRETREALQASLHGVVPEIELAYKAELVFEINTLKRQCDAVILGHNYMEPALYYGVADHIGDSLELARVAEAGDAETIVFCGVRFMAETAKMLAPEKTVLLPSLEAGCSLAGGVSADDVCRLRERFPSAPVVSYVNSYADVKAESDACCTSGNAANVVASFDESVVLFVPDEYLARNVARETGRTAVVASDVESESDLLDRSAGPFLVAWPGRCEVHERFSLDDVDAVRRQFPDALVLAHPECRPEVIAASDFSGSTAAMIRHVRQTSASRYLLLTECNMGENIAAENPDKEMLRLCSVRCPHMNAISLEATLASLRERRHVIDVPRDVAARARRALDRMLAVPRDTAESGAPATRTRERPHAVRR